MYSYPGFMPPYPSISNAMTEYWLSQLVALEMLKELRFKRSELMDAIKAQKELITGDRLRCVTIDEMADKKKLDEYSEQLKFVCKKIHDIENTLYLGGTDNDGERKTEQNT